jgi:molecular chaperone DnaJ
MAARKRDCYQTLGVTSDATPEEVRKAFRREAQKHHPDRNQGDPVAEAKFKEVNEAYQILSDDKQRAIYDQFGWEGLQGGGADGHGFTGVQDVFNTMQDVFAEAFNGTFGSRVPPNGRRGEVRRNAKRGQDLRVAQSLSLRESIFGCTKVATVRSAVVCTECEGSGARRGTQPEVCRNCSGTGQTSQTRGFVLFSAPCQQCRGSGQLVAHVCSACRGQRAVETERQVEVHFPPGIVHGHNVRVHGYGLPGTNGGLPGDLIVAVSVLPDERFERSADDLVVQVHILFTAAIIGGDIKVPVLDASGEDVTVTVQIPPGTQHGATIRLPGHGIHRWHQGGRGSLNVVIHVDVPARLSDRARALVAELNAELLGAVPGAQAAVSPQAPASTPPPDGASSAPSAAAVQAEQDAKVRLLDSQPLRRSDEFG